MAAQRNPGRALRYAGGSARGLLIHHHRGRYLKEARRILECSAGDACVTACPRCVLARDLQYDAMSLDRHATIAFLDAKVLPKIDTPPALMAFGPKTRIETRPLVDVLDAELARHGALRLDLFLHGAPCDWDFSGWPLRRLLRKARDRAVVRLIATPAGLLSLTTGQKLSLDRILSETGARLAQIAELPRASDGRVAIADIGNPSEAGVRRYAAGSDVAAMIGPDWGTISTAPLPYALSRQSVEADDIPPDAFFRIGLENALRLEIGSEVDGSAGGFGRRFWEAVMKGKPQIAAHARACGLERIVYSDRYLVSPVVVRLLSEIILAAPGRDESAEVVVTTAPPTRQDGDLSAIWTNWPRAETRDAVLHALLRDCAQRVEVTTSSRRDMPHDRTLSLRWTNGAQLVMTLDQGFGAWRAEGRPRHDFIADPAGQAASLATNRFNVKLDRTTTPIILQFSAPD